MSVAFDKEVNERTFTALTDSLRKLQIPGVQELMCTFWNLIESKKIWVAQMDDLPVLTFIVIDQEQRAFVVMPPNWYSMAMIDPTMQMGAAVFMASQARDFIEGKTPDKTQANKYEYIFLNYLLEHKKDWKPNKYQQTVLETFKE